MLAHTRKTLSLNVTIQQVSNHLQLACRSFSSGNRNNPNSGISEDIAEKEPTIHHLDVKHILFGPTDSRLPLPGNIGFSFRLQQQLPLQKNQKSTKHCDVLTGETNYDRQVAILDQELRRDFEDSESLEELYEEELKARSKPGEMLEVKLQECPELLKKDFVTLFPAVNIAKSKLSVLTFTQKTIHDMSSWSEDTEEEREKLTEYFVETAKEICRRIRSQGHWADFVDPTSGRPYLGDYTPATFFETDCRYRQFGFTIEDLGCCKVLRHHKWGTHCFVGSIFTNAPLESDVVAEVLAEMDLLNHNGA